MHIICAKLLIAYYASKLLIAYYVDKFDDAYYVCAFQTAYNVGNRKNVRVIHLKLFMARYIDEKDKGNLISL